MATKLFSLKDEAKVNKFWAEHIDEIGDGGVMANVEPGYILFQLDNGIERRGLLNGLRKAHGDLLAKKLSREADKRFFTAELIKANGMLPKLGGGTGRHDEFMGKIHEIEKQIGDIEAECNLYDHQLRTNKELFEKIKKGEYDEQFI
jgi:hypothetical protein